MTDIPKTQWAVQLVGKDELRLNKDKPVDRPGAQQVLAEVEAVGLCFSDLKLLKQFDEHVRKQPIVRGLSAEVLAEIPSYVPGGKPTVPGHEVVFRIVAVGPEVKHHKVGERCMIQADYRELKTADNNGAFGYNFEGGLQQYVLMDERVIVDSGGQRFAIPVPNELDAAAVALVEPWACVEDAYVSRERRTLRPGGRLLVVCDKGRKAKGVEEAYSGDGAPAEVVEKSAGDDLAALADESFDDIVYFGADAKVVETLNDKLGHRGICNLVTGGAKIGPASISVGRVHYGLTRWIGTVGGSAAEAYKNIPATGEIRPGEKIAVIGAAGPMGQMHTIRLLCSGVEGISVVATDIDDARLATLHAKVDALAAANQVPLRVVNTASAALGDGFTYYALMVPAPALLAEAVRCAGERAIVNVFAGIAASKRQQVDLDAYVARRCFLLGTSGSTIDDMKRVLTKVRAGRLDTNRSVDAVSGLAGAIDGIRAVENRALAGKIIVYPQLRELPLIPLAELAEELPTVAAKLDGGAWTAAAEAELLRTAAG